MSLRFLAVVIAAAGLVACSSNKSPAPQPPAPQAEAPAQKVGRPDAEGKVHIQATADDFVPSRIEVEADKPVTLVFHREVEKTCMNRVVFPELGIEEDIPLNTPVEIEITPKAGGTIAFQCPMGMGKSAVVTLPRG